LSGLDAIFMRRSVRAYTAQSLDEPNDAALATAFAERFASPDLCEYSTTPAR
jgi:hypothetical protein